MSRSAAQLCISTELIEVDWAGDPAQITDPDTGEIIPAFLFVGVMTYSQYPYVEAFINEKQRSWITAHVHMYEYFGGVTRILVPDNTTTAVIHNNDWYNQELNTIYHEMAEHYNTAIIPARVRAPKDKPNAEGSVGVISTWITAALRNEQFFSLAELNKAIRIASHRRLYGRKGQYSTVTEHMPADHQKYLEWNGDRFRKWAERIGTNTCKVVHAILASQRVEQQSYRSCMGLLKLADKYSAERLEAACRKALSYTASPSYKSIKNILAAGQEKIEPELQTSDSASTQNKHAITRGADYYRR